MALDSRDKSVTLEAFNGGIANFDTLFSICLIVFQSIKLEGWVDVMYLITDASSGFYSSLYFLAVVFIGAFLLMNVTLAVVFRRSKNRRRKLATQVSDALFWPDPTTRCQICAILAAAMSLSL